MRRWRPPSNGLVSASPPLSSETCRARRALLVVLARALRLVRGPKGYGGGGSVEGVTALSSAAKGCAWKAGGSELGGLGNGI